MEIREHGRLEKGEKQFLGRDDARMGIKLAAGNSGQEISYEVYLQRTSESQRVWTHGL